MILNILVKTGLQIWENVIVDIGRINPGCWRRREDLASIAGPPMPAAAASFKGH